MMQILWFLQFLLVVFVSLPFALLPYRISLISGEFIGSLLFHLCTRRRGIALENLKTAIRRHGIIPNAPPEEIILQHFRNLGKSFVEIVKIYYGLGNQILKDVEIRGVENFNEAHAKGKGVILITGHCGNWELLGLAMSLKSIRINGVARPQNNPYMTRVMEKARGKYGNNIIYKKGALRKILSSLKKNETIGILMDQSVVKSEGIVIDFLGKKAYTMKMPAVIARKTGAPVLTFFIRRSNGSHVIEIGKEIRLDTSEDSDLAVINDTIRFSGCIEDYIRKNPSEWLWIHRKWKRIKD